MRILSLAAVLFLLTACGDRSKSNYEEVGLASYYDDKFIGRTTASGERYSPEALTAAHRTLPFNTVVRVTNLTNNKSVVLRINDRGPGPEDRIIDVSKRAAGQLDFITSGLARVRVEAIE